MVRIQFKQAYNYLMDKLKSNSIEHYLHELASETAMIDIWYNKQFYVIQFEQHFIGYTEVNGDKPGMGSMPEVKFYDAEKFVKKMEDVFA